jgi:hypothetical protein
VGRDQCDRCDEGCGRNETKLVSIAIEDTKDEYFISEAGLEDLHSFTPDESAINFIPYRDTFLKGQREIVDRFLGMEHGDKPFSRWKGKLINDPLATIIHNGRVVGVGNGTFQKGRRRDPVRCPAKSVEKTIASGLMDLAGFIRGNLGEIRLQGLDYGPHQMTCIHDLKAFWGRSAGRCPRLAPENALRIAIVAVLYFVFPPLSTPKPQPELDPRPVCRNTSTRQLSGFRRSQRTWQRNPGIAAGLRIYRQSIPGTRSEACR